MSDDSDAPRTPVRREPPPFRRVAVRRIEDLSPRMRRVMLGGPELAGLVIDEPAASVRLLLPPPGASALVMPTWTGNQFELPGGDRAPIRTFTPRRLDRDDLTLTLDLVVHASGAASDWVCGAAVGDEVAVSGPGRGDPVRADADGYLLAGDETALPAIAQLLEELPTSMPVQVHVEVSDSAARIELPEHRGADVAWHVASSGARPGDAFVAAVEAMERIPDGVWVAGEAAAVQRLRRHLFEVRGRTRSDVTVRGYWKLGRSAT